MARLSHQKPTAPSLAATSPTISQFPHQKAPSFSSQRPSSPLAPPLPGQKPSNGSTALLINVADIHKTSFVAGVIASLVIYLLVQQWYLAIVEKNPGATTFLVLGTSILSWAIGRQQDNGSQRRAQDTATAPSSTTSPQDNGRTSAVEEEVATLTPRAQGDPTKSPTFLREPAHLDGEARDEATHHKITTTVMKGQPYRALGSPSPPPTPEFESALAREKARQKHEESKRLERERDRVRKEKEKERRAKEKVKKERAAAKEREKKENEERELEAERKALEKIEKEKRESEQRELETKEKEAAEKERQIRERLEKQAKELKERAAMERIARAKLEMEAREREIREKAEKEAREKVESELRERLEKETREKIEREAKERENQEQAKKSPQCNGKDTERNQELRRRLEEYKRGKEKEEQDRKAKMDKQAREQEFRERREKREREKAEREAFHLAAEREVAERAAKEKAKEEAKAKFLAAREALAAKKAAAIAAGVRGLSPSPDGSDPHSPFGLNSFGFTSSSSLGGSAFQTSSSATPRKNSIRGVSAPRSPEPGQVRAADFPDSPAPDSRAELPDLVHVASEQSDVQRKPEAEGGGNHNSRTDTLPLSKPENPPSSVPVVKVELVNEEVAAAEAAVQQAGNELALTELPMLGEEPRERPDSRNETDSAVEESYDDDEDEEDEEADTTDRSDEPYPVPPPHEELPRSSADIHHLSPSPALESMLSESSASYFTDISGPTTQQESSMSSSHAAHKPYSTLDPDKIVIAGVYLFDTNVSSAPVGKLEADRGEVTDGLILRITTEGMFIDDDIRGVAERDWDVKAWTMKLVEVWCPVLRGRLPNVNHGTTERSLSSDGQKHHKSLNPFRHSSPSTNASSGSSSITDEESANCLLQLFQTCRETCYGLRSDNTGSALGDYHVLRTSVRDVEGKSFVFVLRNEEAWKISVGLQRLKRGSQVRSLGVCGLPVDEAGDILHDLGWM